MITAIIAIGLLAAVLGLLLGYAAIRFHVESDPLVDKIEAMLPQTQCGQCGYAGCHPYAEAVAAGEADINRCPPGGEQTIRTLADLLDREPKPLDEEVGEATEKAVAFIDEALCIGCTKCIQACPVDAILGAPKLMHTIIEAECTGCELCVPVCPVDCVYMVPVRQDIRQWTWPYPKTSLEPLENKGVADG